MPKNKALKGLYYVVLFLQSGFSLFKTLKIHGLLLSVIYAYGLTDYIDRSPPLRAWLLCAIRCECVTELNRPYADYQHNKLLICHIANLIPSFVLPKTLNFGVVHSPLCKLRLSLTGYRIASVGCSATALPLWVAVLRLDSSPFRASLCQRLRYQQTLFRP